MDPSVSGQSTSRDVANLDTSSVIPQGYKQIGVVNAVVPMVLLQHVSQPEQDNVRDSASPPKRTEENAMLVSKWVEDKVVELPEPSGEIRLTTSPTLHLLRTGLDLFLRYTTTDDGERKNLLKIYRCVLPKTKDFNVYKRLDVIENQTGMPTAETTVSTLFGTFSLINRYIKCFANLAEFSYEFAVPDPGTSRSGLSNVLVVEKVWCYDNDNGVFAPTYRPLRGDEYTDYVIGSLKNFYLCDNVIFISTLQTALFSNGHALALRKVKEPPSELGASSANDPKDNFDEAESVPPKKRKRYLAAYTPTTEDAAEQPPPEPAQSTTTPDNDSQFANPALIVFKQNFFKRCDTLVCPISVEIHLSGKINLYLQ